VDWLITGALLASRFALVLTSRIESRLSASLRSLVALAGRLLDGEPVGEIPRPAETDLADVLDVVRSMNEQVQQREISLRHQEELLRITLSTLAPAVMVLEPSGDVRFANPSAERLMEAHGSLPLDVVRKVWRTGASQPPATETMQPLPGQDLTWRVGVTDAPLPDGSRGVVAVVDDVTDVVRADRLRQLNQLARIVAHEVKNPLTPVRLWMQELEEGLRRGDPDLDQLVKDACREISLQVDRLQMTASSFSNLVALEHWEPEPVDLVAVVDDTLAGLTILDPGCSGGSRGRQSCAGRPPVAPARHRKPPQEQRRRHRRRRRPDLDAYRARRRGNQPRGRGQRRRDRRGPAPGAVLAALLDDDRRQRARPGVGPPGGRALPGQGVGRQWPARARREGGVPDCRGGVRPPPLTLSLAPGRWSLDSIPTLAAAIHFAHCYR
jgi:signal transduction histidine kinase